MVRKAQLFMVDYFGPAKTDIPAAIQQTEFQLQRIVIASTDLYRALQCVCSDNNLAFNDVKSIVRQDEILIDGFIFDAK